MKFIDIIKEALHLLFATDEDLSGRSLPSLLADEAVGDLTRAIPGSINRALSDLERRRILPVAHAVLNPANAENRSGQLAFSLAALPNYGTLCRVALRAENGYTEPAAPYALEGDTLLLPALADGTTPTVLYTPKVPRVDAGTDAQTDLPLPENLAALLPLYVGSECAADENPALAADLRARYESALAHAERPEEGAQSCVKATFSLAGCL